MIYFGAAYYPEHRDPAKWEGDIDLMAGAGVNVLRMGEFAWKRFEPERGRYDFGWMEAFMEKAFARGIQAYLCPPLRTIPAWLMDEDPSVAILLSNDVREAYGSRYTFCINHPLLRERGFALARAMARHFGRNPAVAGWHLDNEFGDEHDCHCAVCVERWHRWLEQRYGTVGRLNESWGTVFWGLEYDEFAQVQTPGITKAAYNPAHWVAWRTFRSDCTIETARLHAEAVRPHVQAPVSTNNQCIWNMRTDYFELAKYLDVCGTNYYPPYGPECRSRALGLSNVRGYKKGNFHVFDLRNNAHMSPGMPNNAPAPGEIERLTMHCIGNGADGIFYFAWKQFPFGCEQWHGGITDHDGRPGKTYAEVAGTGTNLGRIAPLLDGTTVRSDVAVIYDFKSRWYMDMESGWISHKWLWDEIATRVYGAVRAGGRNCDTVSPADDFEGYRMIIVPMLYCIDDAVVERLRRFVENGGTLVWHPFCGTANGDCAMFNDRLHPGLVELFGATIPEYTTQGKDAHHTAVWNGKEYEARYFFDLIAPAAAEPEGGFKDTWFSGFPVVTRNNYGQGAAVYVASYMDDAFYRDLFAELCEECGIGRILDTEIPAAVEVCERRSEGGERYVFLLNSTTEPVTMNVPGRYEDVWNQEMLGETVPLRACQVRVLKMTKEGERI